MPLRFLITLFGLFLVQVGLAPHAAATVQSDFNTDFEKSACLADTTNFQRAIAVRLRLKEWNGPAIEVEVSPEDVAKGQSVEDWGVTFSVPATDRQMDLAAGFVQDGWAVYQLADIGGKQAFLVSFMYGRPRGAGCQLINAQPDPLDIVDMPTRALQLYVSALGGNSKASAKSLRAPCRCRDRIRRSRIH